MSYINGELNIINSEGERIKVHPKNNSDIIMDSRTKNDTSPKSLTQTLEQIDVDIASLKSSITNIGNNVPVIYLSHNDEVRVSGPIGAVQIHIDDLLSIRDDFITSIVFSTNITSNVNITFPYKPLNGTFTIESNNRYNLIFFYDGEYINLVYSALSLVGWYDLFRIKKDGSYAII